MVSTTEKPKTSEKPKTARSEKSNEKANGSDQKKTKSPAARPQGRPATHTVAGVIQRWLPLWRVSEDTDGTRLGMLVRAQTSSEARALLKESLGVKSLPSGVKLVQVEEADEQTICEKAGESA